MDEYGRQNPVPVPVVYTVKRPRIGWSPWRTVIVVAAVALIAPSVLCGLIVAIGYAFS